MQHSLGETIRQIRRLRRLTQRDLGGDRYSKSYVSAVEHNRIAPSAEALRFFARRLGQAGGNFAALLEQPDIEQVLAALETPLPGARGDQQRDAALSLLQTLLEQAELPGAPPSQALLTLAPGTLASLPPPLQARSYMLLGQGARMRGELAPALHALEAALALTPPDQQAAILDEIGLCYYEQRAYHTALGYHLHALRSLHLPSPAVSERGTARLAVALELHSGEDYRALGAYRQALAHYEAAHASLSAHHDLATAGQVYVGLGSLRYATLFSATAPSAASALPSSSTPEEIERAFERASGFLHQGMGFCRTGGDRLGEAHARLVLASLQLDWAAWRRRRTMPDQLPARKKKFAQALPETLLDNAAEHCRQVLVSWQEPARGEEAPLPERDTLLSTALALLIRIAVQRATRARLGESTLDAAYRERAFAAHLCQLVLDGLATPAPPWAIASQAVALSAERLAYRSPKLPRSTDLPDLLTGPGETLPHDPRGLVEVYAAAGEVAEELGRAATVPAFAHDCYAQANQYLQAALSLAYALHAQGAREPGELSRLYQRWIGLLEERRAASPALSEEATQALLRVLQQGFWHLQPSSQEEPSTPGGEVAR